jgi:hypothetical protein
MVVIGDDWESAEQCIAVGCAAEPAILTDAKVVTEILSNRVHLVVFTLCIVHPDNFLQRNNVRIDLSQHLSNAHGSHTPVESATLMNVVGCNAQ